MPKKEATGGEGGGRWITLRGGRRIFIGGKAVKGKGAGEKELRKTSSKGLTARVEGMGWKVEKKGRRSVSTEKINLRKGWTGHLDVDVSKYGGGSVGFLHGPGGASDSIRFKKVPSKAEYRSEFRNWYSSEGKAAWASHEAQYRKE